MSNNNINNTQPIISNSSSYTKDNITKDEFNKILEIIIPHSKDENFVQGVANAISYFCFDGEPTEQELHEALNSWYSGEMCRLDNNTYNEEIFKRALANSIPSENSLNGIIKFFKRVYKAESVILFSENKNNLNVDWEGEIISRRFISIRNETKYYDVKHKDVINITTLNDRASNLLNMKKTISSYLQTQYCGIKQANFVTYNPAEVEGYYWCDYRQEWGVNVFNKETIPLMKKREDWTLEDIKAINNFIKHQEYKFEDEERVNIYLDFLANLVQNPGRKLPWAPYEISKMGTGKGKEDILLSKIVGLQNFSVMAATNAGDRFNNQITKKILVILDEANKFKKNKFDTNGFYELRRYISEEFIISEDKNRNTQLIENPTNFILRANGIDFTDLDKNERRFWVVETKLGGYDPNNMDDDIEYKDGLTRREYLERFVGLRKHSQAIAGYLMEREITTPEIKMIGDAPKNNDFAKYYDKVNNKIAGFDIVKELINKNDIKDMEFNCEALDKTQLRYVKPEVVVSMKLLQEANKVCASIGIDKLNNRSLFDILRRLGFEPVEKPVYYNNKQLRVWALNPHMKQDDIKEIFANG